MFKRVEKKLARKKEEEELGITEEIKDAVGLNDLGDSDDSTSDESEASSSSSTPRIPSKRKHLSEEDPDDGSFGGHGSGGASDVSGEDEDDYGFQMTVEEALNNPLFIVSIQPDIRGCIVCPRRVLKNDTMISVHMKSHVRPVLTNVKTFPDGNPLPFPSRSAGPSATDVQVQGSSRICQTG